MNDTQSSLMTAILLEPDADLPRLVLADWLDDNAADLPDPAWARARAEFIRIGCRIASTGNDAILCTCPQPAKQAAHDAGCLWMERFTDILRERELMDVVQGTPFVGAGWCVAISRSKFDSLPAPKSFVQRGFVDEVVASWADWLAVAGRIAWGRVPCERCHDKSGAVDPRETLVGADCPACAGRGWSPPTEVCPECEGLKRGDLVAPADGNHLACGSGLYSTAVVVSLNPFALVSERVTCCGRQPRHPRRYVRLETGITISPQ